MKCPGVFITCLTPATFRMYASVPSQEPVIMWLAFLYVFHIFFFRSNFVHKLGR